jgi:DNA-binding response OmpR family regulator
MHISIIEDELLLGEKMRIKLINQWYLVSIFTSYKEFMTLWTSDSHLYVVDIGLWDWSGFDIITWLRKKQNSQAPIIITSWYGETDKIVYGLNIGADDYMIKPCIPDEFIARVDALARRSITDPTSTETLKVFIYKNITYFPHTQVVLRGKEKIYLSKKELLIFELFIRSPHSIITREDIIEHAWSIYDSSEISDTVLNTALSRIRKKLWDEFQLNSLYSYGYILE